MSKFIHDNIHGYMVFSKDLLQFINDPIFMRLKYVYQCPFVDFVFISANHTRYEHSLGTCYLTGLLLNVLQKKRPELQITDRQILLVQIGALLHDLGHGPFSHTYELIASKGFTHEKMSILLMKKIIKDKNLSFSERN